MFLARCHQGVEITDVAFDKGIVWVTFEVFVVFEVTRVGEFVVVDEVVFWMVFDPVVDKVGADKAGAAGDE